MSFEKSSAFDHGRFLPRWSKILNLNFEVAVLALKVASAAVGVAHLGKMQKRVQPRLHYYTVYNLN